MHTESEQPWWRPYDGYLSERDRRVLQASGYGRRGEPGRSPALLVIDVTYAFCGDRPEPILESIQRFRNSSGDAAWSAVGVIERLTAAARERGRPVIYTRGFRPSEGVPKGRWASKNQRAGEDTDAHHDIVAEVAPQADDIVLAKAKPSGFFGTPLTSLLVDLGVDSLIVCGGTTSGCVRATVVDGFSHNYPVAVVAEATFDRLEASHAVALLDMDMKYADVVTAAQAVETLAGPA
jgi:maleamate amidohydrolase